MDEDDTRSHIIRLILSFIIVALALFIFFTSIHESPKREPTTVSYIYDTIKAENLNIMLELHSHL